MPEYIQKDGIVLHCEGLAKIAPNDLVGIAKYFADQIIAIPAADVVPVVRCKDCEHLELRPELPGVPFCRVWQNAVAPDEFCRRGVKDRTKMDGGGGDA